jgi:hypothetical protein
MVSLDNNFSLAIFSLEISSNDLVGEAANTLVSAAFNEVESLLCSFIIHLGNYYDSKDFAKIQIKFLILQIYF